MMLFTKLPCIKTCMTKISFNEDKHSITGGKVSNKSIGFENVEDDFEI